MYLKNKGDFNSKFYAWTLFAVKLSGWTRKIASLSFLLESITNSFIQNLVKVPAMAFRLKG